MKKIFYLLKEKKISNYIGLCVLIVLNLFLMYCYFFMGKSIKSEEVASVNVKKLAYVMNVGQTETVIANNTGSNNDVLWSSSDKEVVDVSNCKGNTCEIIGKKIGETTITVKLSDDNYDTFIVKISEAEILYFYEHINFKGDSSYDSDKKSSPSSNIDETYKKIGAYYCKNVNCSYKSLGKYHALIYDDALYEFEYSSGEYSIVSDKLNDFDSYSIIDSETSVLGYQVSTKDTNNIESKIYLNKLGDFLADKYSDSIINYEFQNKEILILTDFNYDKTYFVNSSNGNIIREYNFYSYGVLKYQIDNKVIYGLSTDFFSEQVLIDENYNLIADGTNFYVCRKYNNQLYLIKNSGDDKYYIYSSNGTMEEKSNIKKIFDMYDKYIVVVNENNKIALIDYQANNVVEFDDWKDEYSYIFLSSGLKNYNEKQEYYIVFENKNIEYGVNGHALVNYYNSDTNQKDSYLQNYTGAEGKAKPVLYLYPTKKTNVTVSLEGFSPLTTTYPKYHNLWEVTAYSNGNLYDKDGNYYYALYWEEESPRLVDFSTGFYVEKKDATKFLEEKLKLIGLNQKERNEFIMYWLPVLEKNGKNLVYFELTDELESYTHLNIKPIPDSLLRVTIHIKKVDHNPNIKEEQLKSFTRSGFTAVEWGGINYEG